MNPVAHQNGEAETETAGPELSLPKTRQDMIGAVGRLCHLLGIPLTIGHIYGLLYLSNRPLNLEEIAKSLGIAKSSARVAARQLLGWRVIKHLWIPGDRRDYYEAEPDLGNVLLAGYDGFLKTRLSSFEKHLEQISSTLDADLANGQMTRQERDHCADRLRQLHCMQQKIRTCLPLIDQLL